MINVEARKEEMVTEVVDQAEMLTPEAAALRLGTSVRFVRRLIAERRIRFFKVGKHVRLSSTDVAEFLAAGCVEPVAVRGHRR